MEVGRQLPAQAARGLQDPFAFGRRWRRPVVRLAVGGGVAELPELARAHDLDHRVVRVQQPQGDPPRIRHAGERDVDLVRQPGHRRLDLGRKVLDPARPRARRAGRDAAGRRQELVDAHPAPGHAAHDRHAELLLQAPRIHRDAVPTGLVHQVQVDDDAVRDVQDLEREVQVPFETGGVDHEDGDVGPPEQDEVARHLLVRASRLQGVGAGQVDDLHPLALVGERPFGARDRLAGPVARVLPEAGQGVEDRALADVGVPGEGDQDVPLVGIEAQAEKAVGAVLCAPAARTRERGGHQCASSGTPAAGSTAIRDACRRRSATSAPRIV